MFESMIIVRNHSETSQPLTVSETLVKTSSNVACLPPHIRRLQEVKQFAEILTDPNVCQQPLKSSNLSRILIENSFKFSSVSIC